MCVSSYIKAISVAVVRQVRNTLHNSVCGNAAQQWRKQEPLLPQTRCVGQNLVNCRNKLYDKTTTKQTELEGYSRSICSKRHDSSIVVLVSSTNSTVDDDDDEELLRAQSTRLGEISKSEVWDKVPEKSTVVLEIPKFPYNTVWDRRKEASCQIPVYIHFGPWSLRSSVTSVLRPKFTSISVFSQFGPRSFRSLGPK